ncbi:unnamed protein product [Caenorhabditis angaria]|uniref:Uncharacterized protein n=1 Tax=Caenorhabditis angaria TaxID=860376 RepID=A0A9P1MWX7_9PELO|nr:unnamed protein product [Caenorhabditis angaria]
MFTLSYTAHTVISISLHFIGIFVGLFVWYLFPKHPTRSIVQLPHERIALVIEPSTVIGKPENMIFSSGGSDKLIDFDTSPVSAIRNYG